MVAFSQRAQNYQLTFMSLRCCCLLLAINLIGKGFIQLNAYWKIKTWNDNTATIKWRAHSSVKNNPLAITDYFHNINAHTKFGENPLIFTHVTLLTPKYGQTDDRQMDLKKVDGWKNRWMDTWMTNVKQEYSATIMWWGIVRNHEEVNMNY